MYALAAEVTDSDPQPKKNIEGLYALADEVTDSQMYQGAPKIEGLYALGTEEDVDNSIYTVADNDTNGIIIALERHAKAAACDPSDDEPTYLSANALETAPKTKNGSGVRRRTSDCLPNSSFVGETDIDNMALKLPTGSEDTLEYQFDPSRKSLRLKKSKKASASKQKQDTRKQNERDFLSLTTRNAALANKVDNDFGQAEFQLDPEHKSFRVKSIRRKNPLANSSSRLLDDFNEENDSDEDNNGSPEVKESDFYDLEASGDNFLSGTLKRRMETQTALSLLRDQPANYTSLTDEEDFFKGIEDDSFLSKSMRKKLEQEDTHDDISEESDDFLSKSMRKKLEQQDPANFPEVSEGSLRNKLELQTSDEADGEDNDEGEYAICNAEEDEPVEYEYLASLPVPDANPDYVAKEDEV
eukprot:m.19661 g.19661  ORF g.19661 m.19661 type:complete len:414 (-) comp6641_c0_seq1:20-1261(-)